MRLPLFIGVLSISLTPVAPAMSATPTQAQLENVVRSFAACIVRRHYHRARSVVIERDFSDMQSLTDPACISDTSGGYTKFPNRLFVGALADALVKKDFKATGFTSFEDRRISVVSTVPAREDQEKTLSDIESSVERGKMKEGFAQAEALAWLRQYGECVVRADPERARLFLLTLPKTAAEDSAIDSIKPILGSCLEFGTMKLNRSMIRDALAVTYYRLAAAKPVSASESVR